MQDIAEAAQVSKATVSRAMRNHSSLPRETCERIQHLARQMGYQAHPYVSALMQEVRQRKVTHGVYPIAYLSPVSEEVVSANLFFKRFLEGARKRAEQIGYHLDVFYAQNEDALYQEQVNRVLYSRSIDGAIVGPCYNYIELRELQWWRFSPVSIGHTLAYPKLHSVENDQLHAMQEVFHALEAYHPARVGFFLNTLEGSPVGARYEMAYNFFGSKSQLEVVEIHIPAHPFPKAAYIDWFKRERPEIVISNDPSLSIFLEEEGIRCPEDYCMVLLDVLEEEGNNAGIRQNYEDTAAAAVNLVDGQLRRNERGLPESPRLILTPGQWVEGRSLPPVPEFRKLQKKWRA